MTKQWIEHPAQTGEMNARAEQVETQVVELLNRLSGEGFSSIELLTGLAAASGDLLLARVGPEAIAPWFRSQADMVDSLRYKPN